MASPSNTKKSALLILLLAAVLAVAGLAEAQESRGSITGVVSDSGGGVIAGAEVVVLNVGTNQALNRKTNSSGQYSALYLIPGVYTVTVDHAGFKKTVNENVQVGVGARVEVDFKLEPKGVAETIEVITTRPLLDSGTASSGQVVDTQLISELPLGDGTAYSLTRLVPATIFNGGYALQRPMDNGNLFGELVGGTGRSEFSLDGSSNVVNVSGSTAMGISPPAEAVQEFRFETVAYDAQVGHTGAGAVNLALKSGTNQLHGSFYFYNRDDSRSANDFASNKNGLPKPARNYNRWGATITGPIIKDKTFFMISYENLADKRTESAVLTVPTAKMRTGDFSELLAAGITIYDPRSAQLAGNVVVRQPFPGNVIPANQINPIARNVMSYYPLPNRDGAADQTNNYFAQQPWNYTYDLEMIRIDHAWNQSNRTYLRFTRNWRDEERSDWAGVQNGVEITRGIDSRYNYNVALGHTAVLSSSLFLDIKAAGLRFSSLQRAAASLDPATLGYSGLTLSEMRGHDSMPRYIINNGIATIGAATPAFGAPIERPFYNYSFNPTLTKIAGNHVIKIGYDFRMLRENFLSEGYKGGQYTFDGTYTRSASNAPSQQGQGLAAFLLGYATSGTIDSNASRAMEVVSHGAFVQDDWRISPKLTLNLGVRYDYEMPLTERYDRMARGFDLTSPSPIAGQAQAVYAANYAAKPADFPVSPAQFQVRGGWLFASSENRGLWNAVTDNIQPRFGFSYKLQDKTVVRGGVGLFVPLFEIGGSVVNQTGFSRSTTMTVTQNQGLNFLADLTNPFPNGLLTPVGSTMGLATNMGNNAGTIVPLDRENAKYWRFSASIQRELPGQMVVELGYVGSRARNLTTTLNLNDLPQQYRTTSLMRDATTEAYLAAQVANPFQGLLPDAGGVNGATIGRGRLLAAYPQFGTINQEMYDGTNSYDAGLIRIEKRFSKGLSIIANYTYSRLTENVSRLNPWDALESRPNGADRPHRLVLAAVAQLPFGKGRKWGKDWNTIVDGILGGWQFSGNYQFQSGEPYVWGNVYYDSGCGDPKDLKATWGYNADGRRYGIDVPAFDTACFYTNNGQPFRNASGAVVTNTATEISVTGNNVRSFPSSWGNFRAMNHNSLDLGLSKSFRLRGRMKLDLRVDAINALNTTIFRANQLNLTPTSATFGTYNNAGQSTVVMYPRDFQIGAKLTF